MTKQVDRRASKRISYVCEVECEGAGLNCLATRINDIGLAGAFIDSLTCYSPGTHLKLRFRINETLIETAAEVRYTMPQMGMGVKFLDLLPEHLAVLERLIEGRPLSPDPAGHTKQDEAEAGQRSRKTPNVLMGNFAVVNMFDVIQLIENNKLSGTLGVMSPATNGEIHFNDGQIVGAVAGNTGIEALKSFLDVSEGSFEFRRSGTHFPQTIQASSNMSLMLDLLRSMDEDSHNLNPVA